MTTIEEKTITIISNTVEIENGNIDYDVDMKEEYEIDSVDLARILYDIEQEFEITFSPRETSNIVTFRSLTELIQEKTQ